MIKLLIVDDEILVRTGLRSIINWEKNGFQIVGDAENGYQALELIEKTSPDIVLTDIIMPELDGLKLIEIVKERYPSIRIVILSCHNDFHYIRKAMKLGVEDYILKLSITPEELIVLLQEIVKKIYSTNCHVKDRIAIEYNKPDFSSQSEKDALFKMLIDENVDYKVFEKNIDSIFPSYSPKGEAVASDAIIALVKIHQNNTNSGSKKVNEKTLQNLVEQQAKGNYSLQTYVYEKNRIAIIINLKECENIRNAEDACILDERDTTERQDIMNDIKEFFENILISARRFLNMQVSIGISKPFSGYTKIKEAYNQAKESIEYSFYESEGGVYVYCSNHFQQQRAEIFGKNEEEKLCYLISICDCNGIKELISEIIDTIKQRRLSLEQSNQIFLEIVFCFKSCLRKYTNYSHEILDEKIPMYNTIILFEFLEDARTCFFELAHMCCELIYKERHGKYRDEIRKIIEYIESHYMEDITLKWAADYVFISETYLSHIFKKEIGKSFVQYLTEIRMKKAADMLIHTNLSVHEISLKVGYYNINYFGRLFKKYTGTSPKQFRDAKTKHLISHESE